MCLRSGSLDLSTVVWDLEMLARLGLSATGVIAFAASGALEAKRREMDAVGIITLACCTAVGGGMIRDVLIGAIPVAALVDLWMLALSVLAALVVMVLVRTWERLRIPLLLCDAVGLGMFTVDGALKGLAFGLHPASAVVVGVITGVAREVPIVFRWRSPLYVVPALLGGALIVGLSLAGWAGSAGMLGTAGLIVAIRVVALRYGWHVPRGRGARSGQR